MKAFALIVALFLSACANLGPQYQKENNVDKTKAKIYFYRVAKFAGSAGSPYICVDNQVVGESVNGGYFSVLLNPGSHVISKKVAGKNSGDFNVSVKPGETYFVRTDFSLFNGAQEATDAGRMAALGLAGGGAIGGATAAVMSGSFFGNKQEKDQALAMLDTRAQKSSLNPGFLTVKPELAEHEIAATNLFKVPAYAKNYCEI